MKIIFTLAAALLASSAMMATNYKDSLQVVIGDAAVTTEANVTVNDNGDGTLQFVLHNFVFSGMPVGNVTVDNVPAQSATNGRSLFYKQTAINITAGDDPTVTADQWLGPQLGEVPITLAGYLMGDRIYAKMDITAMGLNIHCNLGSGFQLPNGDFEAWPKGGSAEPRFWHSTHSASGNFFLLLGAPKKVEQSSDVRPGSMGKSSMKVSAASTLVGIIANGTITTGRLNIGSATASDTRSNYSYLNLNANTEKDKNNDLFFQKFYGLPDAVAVWVKFSQGTSTPSAPYASVNAVLTDGSNYQDPEATTYNNVLAKATNATIATTNGEWTELELPFVYTSNASSLKGQALLMTMTTNAKPGNGSDGDVLMADDVRLIYRTPNVTAATLAGTTQEVKNGTATFAHSGEVNLADVTLQTESHTVTFALSKEQKDGQTELNYLVFADDLSSSVPVKVVVTTSTGVTTLQAQGNGKTTVYDLMGRKVQNMQQGGTYIVRRADGTVVKVQR